MPNFNDWVFTNYKNENIINNNQYVEMYRRKVAPDGHEIIDDKTCAKLTDWFIQKGGIITRGEEAQRRLGEKYHASYMNQGYHAFIRDDASVSDVLEEMYHAKQDYNHEYVTKRFDEYDIDIIDDYIVLRREIDAHRYMLQEDTIKEFEIPETQETQETKGNLEGYLEIYYRRYGEWIW